MEEKSDLVKHEMTIANRESCKLTGILSVIQFNDKELVLNTSMGKLQIVGTNLNVNGFDEKKGELVFTGMITGLKYSEQHTAGKTTKGIVSRMFR